MKFELEAVRPTTVIAGKVSFPAYTDLLEKATAIADYVKRIEVTEENVKECSKLLASIRKASKQLEDERISIKKQLLEPYSEYEAQVKEITGIVAEADSVVRKQKNEIEERQRDEKKKQVKELFELRIQNIEFKEFVKFDDFWRPEYANKTASVNKTETAMAEWMSNKDSDCALLSSYDDAPELLAEYAITGNVREAIQIVRDRHEKEKEIREKVKQAQPEQAHTKRITFVFNSIKEANFAEMLLKNNGIEFERIN